MRPQPPSGAPATGCESCRRSPTRSARSSGGIAEVIWHVVEFLWSWSFGQIVGMFRLPLDTLPLWKQLLFVAVLSSLGYLFHKIQRTC